VSSHGDRLFLTRNSYDDRVGVDVEAFVAWLRKRGTPEAHLDAYRHYAGELAGHADPQAGVRDAEASGAPPQRIANLYRTACLLAEYDATRRPVQAIEIGRAEPPDPLKRRR
jgi:hypothetical protein